MSVILSLDCSSPEMDSTTTHGTITHSLTKAHAHSDTWYPLMFKLHFTHHSKLFYHSAFFTRLCVRMCFVWKKNSRVTGIPMTLDISSERIKWKILICRGQSDWLRLELSCRKRGYCMGITTSAQVIPTWVMWSRTFREREIAFCLKPDSFLTWRWTEVSYSSARKNRIKKQKKNKYCLRIISCTNISKSHLGFCQMYYSNE